MWPDQASCAAAWSRWSPDFQPQASNRRRTPPRRGLARGTAWACGRQGSRILDLELKAARARRLTVRRRRAPVALSDQLDEFGVARQADPPEVAVQPRSQRVDGDHRWRADEADHLAVAPAAQDGELLAHSPYSRLRY